MLGEQLDVLVGSGSWPDLLLTKTLDPCLARRTPDRLGADEVLVELRPARAQRSLQVEAGDPEVRRPSTVSINDRIGPH
jgi:hypothetical protein